MSLNYDIIVVGAGHAGCEAANISAVLGSKVLLITMNMQTIAQMSCNPAMGGIAKGQIVREIDVLGGLSGIISDESMIQFRMLNRSKGPAMWSPRSQNDRMYFSYKWRLALEKNKNIDFWQDMVKEILVKKGKVIGVKTNLDITFYSKSVIFTNGTFLNGLIHIGNKCFGGGRSGEKAATGLTEQLIHLGFKSGRMKTGTPPRIDGRSINYEATEEQKGDKIPSKFSFSDKTRSLTHQKNCFITYTNSDVHNVLKSGFDLSPMFNGRIKSLGPRYCPSIEDKINRFSERNRHQLFIEPEGWDTIEIYLNGFSTSLPEEIQFKALRKIKGFEKVKMFRPGYAIEYDFFPPTQLSPYLETKLIKNLFFAGQINGTTGYEEAACQGLIAGINAHQTINGDVPFILNRSEAYIGVLIDDLVNKGTEEPYRMFTSRAEYRILLRQDNADLRLGEIAHRFGLIEDSFYKKIQKKQRDVTNLLAYFPQKSLTPEEVNPWLVGLNSTPIHQKTKISQLLKRPNISIGHLEKYVPSVEENLFGIDNLVKEQAEIQLKYDIYIQKEKKLALKLNTLENIQLKDSINYYHIKALSNEAKEKLTSILPHTLGQASRISGISPADISILTLYLNRQK